MGFKPILTEADLPKVGEKLPDNVICKTGDEPEFQGLRGKSAQGITDDELDCFDRFYGVKGGWAAKGRPPGNGSLLDLAVKAVAEVRRLQSYVAELEDRDMVGEMRERCAKVVDQMSGAFVSTYLINRSETAAAIRALKEDEP